MALKPTIIVGLGTGRSGTTSLAATLSTCERVSVTHEEGPFLPWTPTDEYEKDAVYFFEAIETKAKKHDLTHVGDVAHNWLPYVPRLRERYGARLRCLALTRDRNAVVASFMRHMPHAVTRDKTLGEQQFPTYHMEPEKAFGAYWEMYHQRLSAMMIPTFRIDALNDDPEALMDAVGIDPAQRILATHHLN